MKNTSTALIINNPDSVNALINIELRKNVSEMLQAMSSINGDTWKFAIAVSNIIESNLYKDDFENLEKFATVMDTTKSTLSRYNKSVLFITNDLSEYGYNDENGNVVKYSMENMTYGKSYVLSTLKEESFKAFMKKHKKTNFSRLAQSQIEKLVKEWKEKEKKAVETEVSETEETENNEVEVSSIPVEALLVDGKLEFTINEKKYSVPIDKLNKYIVETEEA